MAPAALIAAGRVRPALGDPLRTLRILRLGLDVLGGLAGGFVDVPVFDKLADAFVVVAGRDAVALALVRVFRRLTLHVADR